MNSDLLMAEGAFELPTERLDLAGVWIFFEAFQVHLHVGKFNLESLGLDVCRSALVTIFIMLR